MLNRQGLHNAIDTCIDGKGSSYRPNDLMGTQKLFKLSGGVLLRSQYENFQIRFDGNAGEFCECASKVVCGQAPTKSQAGQADLTYNGIDYEIKTAANSKDKATPLYVAKNVLMFTPDGVSYFPMEMVANIIANPFACDFVSIVKNGGIRFKRNAFHYGIQTDLTEKLNKAFGF